MRYLGIDYGQKRVGIAVSDPEGRIAFPKKIIFNYGNRRVLEEIKGLIKEEKVSKVIIGLPLAFDGSDTEETKTVRKFAEDLNKEVSTAIEFENEMLTSRMAERAGIKKEHVDKSAAALILQSYLDKLNR